MLSEPTRTTAPARRSSVGKEFNSSVKNEMLSYRQMALEVRSVGPDNFFCFELLFFAQNVIFKLKEKGKNLPKYTIWSGQPSTKDFFFNCHFIE